MDKKAVSLMVSYTMLIVIAITLSIMVYGYLKLYVPGNRAQCPQDISLVMESAECDIGTEKMTVALSNHGLFNVSGAYIRVGRPDKATKVQINKDDEFFDAPLSPNSPTKILQNLEIPPSALLHLVLGNSNEIEIQPMVLVDNKFAVPCEEAVVTYSLTCT
jgi:hypothetical protein